jgi:hypothetical protein
MLKRSTTLTSGAWRGRRHRHGCVRPTWFTCRVSDGRHQRSPSEWTLTNRLTLIGVVVAVLTLVVTWLAYQNGPDGREVASTPPTTPPTAPYTYAPAVAEPAIRHRNRIELEPGKIATANLDAPQSSPDWSFDDGSPPELRFTDEVRLILDSGEIMTTGRRLADYSTCLAATGYERRSYEEAYLIVGDSYCVRTSEGRIATFRFIGARPDLLTIDAVVYEPQHDF